MASRFNEGHNNQRKYDRPRNELFTLEVDSNCVEFGGVLTDLYAKVFALEEKNVFRSITIPVYMSKNLCKANPNDPDRKGVMSVGFVREAHLSEDGCHCEVVISVYPKYAQFVAALGNNAVCFANAYVKDRNIRNITNFTIGKDN